MPQIGFYILARSIPAICSIDEWSAEVLPIGSEIRTFSGTVIARCARVYGDKAWGNMGAGRACDSEVCWYLNADQDGLVLKAPCTDCVGKGNTIIPFVLGRDVELLQAIYK